MGKAKKLKELRKLYQPGYVRFIKYNDVFYCLDSEAPGGVSPVYESSRYQGGNVQIIDAAVADLADCQDGSWVFGKERTWMVFPYSLPEILGIANYDSSISELINRATPTRPLFPEDMEAYLEELKNPW